MTKNIVLCLGLFFILSVATACSQQISPDSNTSTSTEQNSVESASNTSNEGFSTPVVAPPSYNNRPAQPGQSPASETMPNGLPALKPLKGVNVDTLFSENISDTDRRFERVENAVVDLRREFEVMKPAIVRLVAVEGDIQALVQQLEALAQQDGFTPPSAPPPVQASPLPPAEQEFAQVDDPSVAENSPTSLVPSDTTAEPGLPPGSAAPAAIPKVDESPPAARPPPSTPPPQTSPQGGGASDGTIVQNLRTGVHPGKVRLVLDISKQTPFSVDLDAGENILLIEMPEARWQGPASNAFGAKDALFSSYNVESINDGKGSRIILTLKKQTRILEQKALPPSSTPYHRVYVDLAL